MAITKNSKPLGKYGRMRRTYLKEHQKAFYIQLQARGVLWQHLREVDEQAQSMVNTIVARMAEIDGVTEELKAPDPEPTSAPQNDTTDPPAANLCSWDNVDHGTSFFGRITKWFHTILWHFSHLLGRK